MLFGAICNDPAQDADRLYQPYLEIIDPTNCAYTATLELDKIVVENASIRTTVDISVGRGAGCEGSSLVGNEGTVFVSDASRGIITADFYLCHRHVRENRDSVVSRFESHVFVMAIEDVLAKAPSPSDPERCCIEWKDLSPSAAVFSYFSEGSDRYRLFSRHSYVAGFRYASPIQPLVPKEPKGPRCFFIYDFNPYRETSDLLPGVVLEDPDPKTNYPSGASEITREVIGGLSCWKMRFDLPGAEEDVEKCHVALTEAGIVLFEVCHLVPPLLDGSVLMSFFLQLNGPGEESITVFSIW